jgi:hypothetical protein
MNEPLPIEPEPENAGALITVEQRARIAVKTSAHEAKLIELAKNAKTITAITNKDGYAEAHATRMVLKNTRLSITKSSKDAREDAQAFAKAVIAEENRLVAIISPEETRIEALQKAWDDAIEAEKQRKIDAERARVQAVKDRIEEIRRYPLDAVGKDAAAIGAFLESCAEIVIDEAAFAEHAAYAAMIKAESITALTGMRELAIHREAEEARAKQERAELEARREQDRLAEQAREEEARIRREQEAANLRAERELAERREREATEALRRQQEESDRLTRELEAVRKANEERVAAEQRAAEHQADMVRRAVEAVATPLQHVDETHSVETDAPEATTREESVERPSDAEIIEVIADHFGVSNAVALEWIVAVQFFNQPSAENLLAA